MDALQDVNFALENLEIEHLDLLEFQDAQYQDGFQLGWIRELLGDNR